MRNWSRRRRGVSLEKPVLKYGEVETSAEEDKILSFPSRFTTFTPITMEKLEDALQMTVTKARWELRSRRVRNGAVWSKEWEVEQQRKREVTTRDSR